MDLLSQEWSHLKGMLAVLLTMSNFQHFIAQWTLRNQFSLSFPVEKRNITPKFGKRNINIALTG